MRESLFVVCCTEKRVRLLVREMCVCATTTLVTESKVNQILWLTL